MKLPGFCYTCSCCGFKQVWLGGPNPGRLCSNCYAVLPEPTQKEWQIQAAREGMRRYDQVMRALARSESEETDLK
jgi:hypothetical protein